MRIGILTFFDCDNYGATLQGMATKFFLQSHGHDAFLLKGSNKRTYLPQSFLIKDSSVTGNIKFFLRTVLSVPFYLLRKLIIYRFIDKYAKPFNEEWYQKNDNIDCYLVGSDQVWNYSFRGYFRPIFFCQFPGAVGKKCIAYSTSFGRDNIAQQYEQTFINYSKAFSHISVREASAVSICRKLIPEQKVIQTVDPTLLLSKNDWENLLPPCNNRLGKYVLVYEVNHSRLTDDVAEYFSNKFECKIIRIRFDFKLGNGNRCFETSLGFINLIRNAQFVVTTSFHGTVFSIINEIPFISIETSKKESRVQNLLELSGLSKRIISSIDGIDELEPINWDNVHNSLEQYIGLSKDYLINALAE